jgi:hypothetical protein
MRSLEEGTIFCARKNADEEFGDYGYLDPRHTTVRAVFQKPTKFCECSDPGESSPLSKKYHWRIHHPGCNKPKPGLMQHPRNLLDPEDMKPQYRNIYLGVREGPKREMP